MPWRVGAATPKRNVPGIIGINNVLVNHEKSYIYAVKPRHPAGFIVGFHHAVWVNHHIVLKTIFAGPIFIAKNCCR